MPDPSSPTAPRARGLATAVWIALLVMTAGRLALAFVPSMEAWGVDLLRFVSPALGGLVAALAALALVPPIARAATAPLARLAEGRRASVLWVAAVAALVLALPDRSRFVGDFALRETASHTASSDLASLYPQGFPLDALLHDRWVRLAAAITPLGIAEWWRVLGAIEAALLALLAARLARTLGARGAWKTAIAAMVAMGGALALFAGYNKAFAELTLIAVAVGAFGLEVARRRTGLVPLAIAVAAGLLLHRLGLALLPAWIAALAIAWRGQPAADPAPSGATRSPDAAARSSRGAARPREGPRPPTPSRAAIALAAALPLAALAIVLPHLPGAASIDAANFFPAAARRAGWWSAALAPRHLLDLANAIALLAPLAPLALLAPFAARQGSKSETLFLAALALPLLAFPPFFHPPQGVFRDWDALAPTAAALGVVAAWSLAGTLARDRSIEWLAVAIAFAGAAPAVQFLALQNDLGASFARGRAFAEEAPVRGEHERATVWDWVGARYLEIGLVDSASASFERAARLTPSPRILREWAASELMRGRLDRTLAIYRRLLARKPDDVAALVEYAILSHRAGDEDAADTAARRALRLAPGEPRARALLDEMEDAGRGAADSTARR